jgi:hypothetical protein
MCGKEAAVPVRGREVGGMGVVFDRGGVVLAVATVALAVIGCGAPGAPRSAEGKTPPEAARLDAVAEGYVRAVLALGEEDPAYVDAYYGPRAWREEARRNPRDLESIEASAEGLTRRLRSIETASLPEPLRLRREFLLRQIDALRARVAALRGVPFDFDEESRALYGAVAPHREEAEYEGLLARLDGLLPGEGALAARYEGFLEGFRIPPDRVDAVFRAAIDEGRARTLRHLDLPEGESFTVEYVTGKSWAAYNWYQGGARSLIQVNVDLPVDIDRAVDLACHEGYPGHHVYNALLESELFRERGWVEFSVYPLFSPQSLMAEGTANYGIEVAFPGDERLAFEREVLYPLAGLDPDTAVLRAEVRGIVEALGHSVNDVARRYLDGRIDRTEAERELGRLALLPPDRAQRLVRFFDEYRSYVVNYTLGLDLVRAWVEERVGPEGSPEDRWRVYGELLASPRLLAPARD